MNENVTPSQEPSKYYETVYGLGVLQVAPCDTIDSREHSDNKNTICNTK